MAKHNSEGAGYFLPYILFQSAIAELSVFDTQIRPSVTIPATRPRAMSDSRKRKMASSEGEGAAIAERVISGALTNRAVPVRTVPTPKYPAQLFRLHTLAAFFGPRGSGKTNGAVLLAKRYLDYGSFTRVYIISPTFESNPCFDVLDAAPEDVYTDLGTILASIDDIVKKIEDEAELYRDEMEYTAMYEKVVTGKPINDVEQIRLEREGFREPVPMDKPYPLIIIDDCSHSQIYSTSRSNPFVNLCLRHRHIGGEGFGCSIFMLVQNFKTGVPKPIRQNLQQFFIWRTADRSQLEAMWEEFANLIDLPNFVRIYHLATDADRHDFLTVDMNPTSDEIGNFRRNFDTALHMEDPQAAVRAAI